MISFRADLHSHSTCSDGSMTPDQLLHHAAEIGLNALSITDHDTIDAYTPDIFTLAKKLNIELLTGVEFSTILDSVSIHLLGYNFSLENPEILAFCARHKNRRIARYREILKLLAAQGIPIDEEDLLKNAIATQPSQQNRIIGRPHIAQMMIKLGYVETIQEAFKRYLGDGCSCYVQGEYITPEETIEILHNAGGVAVIAHPHLIKQPKILPRLFNMKFDGIECYYSKFHLKDHQRWIKIAERQDLLITGGSDFHGDVKPTTPLGCSWINEELFRKLQNYAIPRPS
ncbi:MAG: PHP domain-containing protein [Parachlamydiaceae bacterium]|nr:PHP domain-containing protein [Parachlamydiaceae bacterium]